MCSESMCGTSSRQIAVAATKAPPTRYVVRTSPRPRRMIPRARAQAARPGGVAVLLPPFVFTPAPQPNLPAVSPFDMVGFIQSATAKILDKAKLLAGVSLDAPSESLTWDNGAFMRAGDSTQVKTIADVALYAHGTGSLHPGVEGGLDAQTVYRD